MKISCPECNSSIFDLQCCIENVEMKSIPIRYMNFCYCCIVCGTEVETAKMLDRNLERARKEYDYIMEDKKVIYRVGNYSDSTNESYNKKKESKKCMH